MFARTMTTRRRGSRCPFHLWGLDSTIDPETQCAVTDPNRRRTLQRRAEQAALDFRRQAIRGQQTIAVQGKTQQRDKDRDSEIERERALALEQIDICDKIVGYSKLLIQNKCRDEAFVCPTTFTDPKTGEERPLRAWDPIDKCQGWKCILDEAQRWSRTFREMVEQDAFRGISLNKPPSPFTADELRELRSVVKSKCRLQMGQLTDTVFGVNTLN